ncbi:GNAT family N-acetyltransferase [Nitratireductor mangrovi]|uniref:GNAT family N-acetyltransferase n=1 Tax=Nitratireductor mangrovi TaxID=2599600 RepID=A0A5B8KTK6_9HYPH|nr:N-acetyltransferase [Nitratireductor mangrovi]QDY98912.1 GNAT family N-acetyltransferase [Nitratireductor mangrovi]
MSNVRKAEYRDVESLLVIEKLCFNQAYYSRMTPRQFYRHLSSPNALLLVVEDDSGTVQGYALGFLHGKRKALRFYSLAVAPDAQRGEYGKQLFGAIEQRAQEMGLGVQCEVREDNEKLINRYTKLGYRKYKTVRDYYPDGAACIKMVKEFL